MAGWQDFAGLNRGYVLEVYEKYRKDPASVECAAARHPDRVVAPEQIQEALGSLIGAVQ